MINQISRGSEWHKWDLHLHSCYSELNNCFSHDTTGKICEDDFVNCIKQSGLSAIGLTNYFNLKKEDLALKNRLNSLGIKTFLNMEVRLSNLNKVDELFDYHVIFDDSLDDQVIKNLMGELKASTESIDVAFNRLSKGQIEHTACISFEELNKILEANEELRGKYIKGFLSRGHGSATSDADPKNQTVFRDIAKKSDFLIHSSDNANNLQKDRNYWLNKSPYVKPLLQNSDAHSLDQIGKKFSWIKADLTFDGLRQILFEPESRISLDESKPDQKSDYLTIDHVKFQQEIDGKKFDKKIYFNSNLNTIIGGRSNGKSTLTNSIAKALKNKNYTKKDENGNQMFSFDNSNFEVFWQGDGQPNNDREVEFLPQDYMIRLVQNDKQRNELIESTVRTDTSNFEKIQNFRKNEQQKLDEINESVSQYLGLKRDFLHLQEPEGDKKGIQSEIKKITQRIKEQPSQSDFSADDGKKYQQQIDSLDQLSREREQIDIDLRSFKNLANQKIELQKDFAGITDETRISLQKYLDDLSMDLNQKWSTKISELKDVKENQSRELDKKIETIKKSPEYLKGNEHISQNEVLSQLIEYKKQEQVRLSAFDKFTKNKENLEEKIKDSQDDILAKYQQLRDVQNTLQKGFIIQAGKNGIVEIKLYFKRIRFDEQLNGLLNKGNKSNLDFISHFDSDTDNTIKGLFTETNLSYNQSKGQDDLIQGVFNHKWFELTYELSYEGDDFNQMSQGKRAFVILTLLLEFSEDKKPVIIDQPEDSLDNRAIYKDLTRYLKTKKRERQIILVTHNPNIVVGSDAENIIVANQNSINTPNVNGIKFDYCNGSLENSFEKQEGKSFLASQGIREHVIEVLEGGSDAFEKREKKYNMN